MSETDAPEISVIIPTFNRADTLFRCLTALENQGDAPETFEIIVCDDGSDDHTARMIAIHAGRTERPFRPLRQPNAGANAARNRAIAMARAPLLLIINDDSIACPDLVARHLARHTKNPAEATAVLGRMTIAPEFAKNPLSPLHHDASFDQIAGKSELDWPFFFTCNVSVSKSLVLAAGGFDVRLKWHEDIELGERLARRGMRLFYEPRALCHHAHQLDAKAYLRIAEREGEALVLWLRARPDLRDTLHRLGLNGAPPFERALRHRVADFVLPRWSFGACRIAAQSVAPLSPGLARALYRRLFQRIKRLSIGDAARRPPSEEDMP